MSKKILLVEDNELLAMTEAHTLEKHGYEVVKVREGEKAIGIVDNNPDINLILMDIVLGRKRNRWGGSGPKNTREA